MVRQIGEALISLQQFGRVKYIGWKLSFSISDAKCEQAGLQDLAMYMEQELEQWKDGVDKDRNQFYNLNYYTAKQLLELRSDLGKLREDTDHHRIAPYTLSLLKSISAKANQQLICKAIQKPELPESEDLEEMNYGLLGSISAHSTELETSDASTHFSLISTTPSDDNLENLSGEKRDVYLRLTDFYDFPKELAKQAIDKFDQITQLQDAYEWCESRDGEIAEPRSKAHRSDEKVTQPNPVVHRGDEKVTQPDPVTQSEELNVPMNSQSASLDEACHLKIDRWE